MPTALMAISPLDGRYADKVDSLRRSCSEFGLICYRVQVELHWLVALSNNPHIKEVPAFSEATRSAIEQMLATFSEDDAQGVKELEAKTNHDVKAVEYSIQGRFAGNEEVQRVTGFVHFACTSEDINNVAHALILEEGRFVLTEALKELFNYFRVLAHDYADVPMVSRTHGQPATPTTLGKEMAVFCYRLRRAYIRIKTIRQTAKWNGAVGNYNAAMVAYPEIDWETFNRKFIESFGLQFNPYTTQIESHDTMVELFDAIVHANTVLLDAVRDLWSYISLGYFKQKLKEGEVGSSTMPHKVNPIDFENSEGNLGIANALLRHLADKLPVSRWQRDLSDSTATRNIGVALGHSLLAYQSCLRGLGKLKVDTVRIAADLDNAWELLAEPVQTVMRRYGVPDAYERLKDLTRGKGGITKAELHAFILDLPIPELAKVGLLRLIPATYTGKAAELASRI